MTEAQIRALFAHIRAVRDRWAREVQDRVGYDLGSYVDIEDGITNDSIEFVWQSYGDHRETNEIPLLAFVDFDAAALPEIARRKAERAQEAERRRVQQERRDREEYERLRHKFEPDR